jgi:hypothetical protein
MAKRKAKSASALQPKNEYMCTHGEDSCLLWKWDDADQWWTIPAGTCDCSECHGFLDQNKHALALAGALKKARRG